MNQTTLGKRYIKISDENEMELPEKVSNSKLDWITEKEGKS